MVVAMKTRKIRPRDLRNMVFGKLTAISRSEHQKSTVLYEELWDCVCECGGTKKVIRHCLIYGQTQSCGCKKRTLPYGVSSLNRVLDNYKANARKRGIAFEMPEDIFKKMVVENCFYCGAGRLSKMTGLRHNGECFYTGIDRIDSSYGYTVKNCVSCCKICNSAKNDMTQKEFVEWIRRASTHLEKQ